MKLSAILAMLFVWDLLVADEYRLDVREMCRLEVSSRLINLKNNLDLMDQSILQHGGKIVSLRERKKDLSKRLGRLESKSKGQVFDRYIEEQMETLQHQIDAIDRQSQYSEKQSNKLKTSRVEAFKALKKYRMRIEKVFKIKDVKTTHHGAYNFSVEYKHKCGRFQYICPLPKNQRTELTELARILSEPEACRRYAQVLEPEE